MKILKLLFLLFFTIQAQSQTIYKTPSGKKYHLSNCRMVTNVATTLSVKDGLGFGLSPCKICKPSVRSNQNNFVQKKIKRQTNTFQCKGQTKAGTRCKHKTSIGNGYCFQHNPDK